MSRKLSWPLRRRKQTCQFYTMPLRSGILGNIYIYIMVATHHPLTLPTPSKYVVSKARMTTSSYHDRAPIFTQVKFQPQFRTAGLKIVQLYNTNYSVSSWTTNLRRRRLSAGKQTLISSHELTDTDFTSVPGGTLTIVVDPFLPLQPSGAPRPPIPPA